MPFTIIENWWTFLDRRTDGKLGQVYAKGENVTVHPRVDEAAGFATSSIYNALVTKYARADVDAFTPSDADAEMRQHAGALAMFSLSSTGGGRTDNSENDYAEAQTWLTKVRNGVLPIAALVAAAAVPQNAMPKGFVRFRARERNFRRGRSGEITDYDLRNPKL